jgi:protein associated with RNAse G/E
MTKIVVHKLDARGREVWTYSGKALRRSPSSVTLEATFDREDDDLQSVRLRRGDRFVETFYADRWYNIFAVHDVDTGALKGWYCNVTRPAYLGEADIYAEDLALDIVVSTEGTIRVLDEDEYASLEISEAERQEVRRAVAELKDLAERGAAPFGRRSAP